MMLTFSKEANYCVLMPHIYCLLWCGNLKFLGDFQECGTLFLPASLYHNYANRFRKSPTVNADNSGSKYLRDRRPCPSIHTILFLHRVSKLPAVKAQCTHCFQNILSASPLSTLIKWSFSRRQKIWFSSLWRSFWDKWLDNDKLPTLIEWGLKWESLNLTLSHRLHKIRDLIQAVYDNSEPDPQRT